MLLGEFHKNYNFPDQHGHFGAYGGVFVSETLIHALDELKDAIEKKDIKEVADALTDILYVTYGAGHAFGIDLDKCFEEVQNSNMSKLGEDGKPLYNDKGKVMKGPNYFKPDIAKVLD